MKKLYILAIFLLLPLLCSCQHSLAFGSIERDQHQIGGNLSFVYNPDSQTATFGGEGEVVQFYGVDLTKGWQEAGCRIGIKLTPPPDVESFEGVSIFVDGKENPPYLRCIYLNGEKTGEIELFPLVRNLEKTIEVKVEWQSGVQSQLYKIKFAQGTTMMQKQSTEK